MTGDASIDAFDNARRALRDLWLHRGLAPASLRELSAADDSAADDVATGRGVAPTSRVTIRAALAALAPRPRDKCLVHMTSHGSPQGFYLAGQRPLQPAELDRMLRFACGTRPTVVLVSACYSGRFLEGEMRRSNRVILTAARADRPSFGCGTDDVFPYWDHCIIDNFASAPTWRALYARARRCVRAKEAAGGFEPSEPQAFFGKDVRDLPIFGTPLARGG